MPGQLSFFSASAMPPVLGDLEGLLLGPGQVVAREHEARISVVVHEAWRAEALLAAMEGLGLAAEVAEITPGILTVRTPFMVSLHEVARSWSTGSSKVPPPGVRLDGPRLRWWFMAAGRPAAAPQPSWELAVGERDEDAWTPAGAALARVGLSAAFVRPRGAGPAYRLTGAKRAARLAELLGEAPSQAPQGAWPS